MTEKELEQKKPFPIKIQLNSGDAVLQFISDNPDLDLIIRNKIACSVAKGYQRIDEEVIKQAVPRLVREVSESVKREFVHTERRGWDTVYVLNDSVEKLIKEKVHKEFNSLIYDAFDEARKEMRALVKERIDSIAEEVVSRTVSEVFEDSVRDEVIRRYNTIAKQMQS